MEVKLKYGLGLIRVHCIYYLISLNNYLIVHGATPGMKMNATLMNETKKSNLKKTQGKSRSK